MAGRMWEGAMYVSTHSETNDIISYAQLLFMRLWCEWNTSLKLILI